MNELNGDYIRFTNRNLNWQCANWIKDYGAFAVTTSEIHGCQIIHVSQKKYSWYVFHGTADIFESCCSNQLC